MFDLKSTGATHNQIQRGVYVYVISAYVNINIPFGDVIDHPYFDLNSRSSNPYNQLERS